MNPMDYSKPIKTSRQDDLTSFGFNAALRQVIDVELILINFSSDDGYVLTSETPRSELNFKSFNEKTVSNSAPSDPFLTIKIKMSSDSIIYRRRYDKIQNVLAKVSGITSTIILLFASVLAPFARNRMMEIMVNDTYQIQTQDAAKTAQKKRTSRLSQLSTSPTKNNEKTVKSEFSLNQEKFCTGNSRSLHFSLEPRDKSKKYLQSPSSQVNSFDKDQNKNPTSFSPNSSIIESPAKKLGSDDKIFAFDLDSVRALTSKGSQESKTHFQKIHLRKQSTDQKQGGDPRLKRSHTANPDQRRSKESRFQEELQEAKPTQSRQSHRKDSNVPLNSEVEVACKSSNSCFSDGCEQDDKDVILECDQEEDSASNKKTLEEVPSVSSKPTNFRVGYLQWAKSFVYSQPETETFKRAKEDIVKQIDLLNIIKRFREIDHLKECLLNKKQRAVFDNLPRPNLVIATSKKKDTKKANNKQEAKGVENDEDLGRRAFDQLNKEADKNELDRKILSLYTRTQSQVS